jgi:hypothetical protein
MLLVKKHWKLIKIDYLDINLEDRAAVEDFASESSNK